MNKLDGGVMDIQKEREAFEAWVNSKGRSVDRFTDGSYKSMTLDNEWKAWQAAKAQAVPDLGELQERIAGHQYYHDEHGHMIVDMDDVVKEIGGFDSWKAQAVPEGFVLVEKKLIKTLHEELLDHDPDSFVVSRDICELWKQAQEPAND